MNPGKEYTDDMISFDYDAKIFFIKQNEKGRYFYGLSREYISTESFYFLDDPGQQFHGIYITGGGKYLFNLLDSTAHENLIPFESYEELKVFLEVNLQNDFVQNLPQRGLLQRFGYDYDSWYAGVYAIFQRDKQELEAMGMFANQSQ